MTFSRLAGAGVILLAAVSFTHSRPSEPKAAEPPPTPSAPPLRALIEFVGDEAFQAELKLTPEQVKKLLALRQKVWDETYSTAPKDLGARQPERDRAVAAAFKDVLDADQIRRAEQLAWQLTWRSYATRTPPFAEGPERVADPTRVPPLLLSRHPGLAAALNLSADQRKLVPVDRPLPSPAMSLTAEQIEVARKLLGPIAKENWTADRDPRMELHHRFVYTKTPALLRVAFTYREELKLTDEQAAAIGKLPRTDFDWKADISPEEAVKQYKGRLTEIEKSLAKLLTPEQFTRLRQIVVQEDHDPALGHAAEPLVVNLAAELGVTPDQHKKLAALRTAHAKAVARAALADDYAAARKGIRAANEALAKGLAEELTADQRAKLKTLTGEPVSVELVGRFRARLGPAGRKQREASFGRYTDELLLLYRNKSIQAELKLTPDQIDLSRKTHLEQNRRFGNVIGKKTPAEELDAKAAAKSKFIGESLAVILDQQQAKRFRQIVIQQREYPDRLLASTSLATGAAYPGVAEELKLTAGQRKRLIGGEHTVDVLTDEQHKALKEMLGERFTGDFRTTVTTTPKTPPATATAQAERERRQFFIVMPWQALDLTPEQVTKLADAVNRHLATERGTAVGTLKEDVKRILADPTALVRVEQLMLQSRAAYNLRDAFDQPDVAKALQLSPAQLTRIADLEEEAGDFVVLIAQSRLRFADHEDVLHRLRDRLDNGILANLTPDQLAKWKELTGDAYPGFSKTVMRAPIYRPSR